MGRDFSKIALYSKLFKGRSNWYFCYLKSEKLAHVLAVLVTRSVSESAEALKGTASFAAQIVQDLIYVAAGEVSEETLLADLFSIVTSLRLHASRGYISKENCSILVGEYEALIERLVGDSRHLGLTVSPQDLEVTPVPEDTLLSPLPLPLGIPGETKGQKDIYKGQTATGAIKDRNNDKGQDRSRLILDFVRKSKGASIKDISKVIQGCSEKTIQRELNVLIQQGLVVREGERRWSTYRSV